LHELAELCNVVGIIERGQLLFSGPVNEILRKARVGHVIHVGVADKFQEATELLSKFPGVNTVTIAEGGADGGGSDALLHVSFEDGQGHDFADIPSMLINNGIRLTQFNEEPVNLETAFMRLTKGLVQ